MSVQVLLYLTNMTKLFGHAMFAALVLTTVILLLNCVSIDDCADQSSCHDTHHICGGHSISQTPFQLLSKSDSFDIGGFTFEIIDANAVSLSKYQQDTKSNIRIPSKVMSPSGTEYVVTKIGEGAFRDQSLTSVVVPDTVREIGIEALRAVRI